jgi:hypothetical protein
MIACKRFSATSTLLDVGDIIQCDDEENQDENIKTARTFLWIIPCYSQHNSHDLDLGVSDPDTHISGLLGVA